MGYLSHHGEWVHQGAFANPAYLTVTATPDEVIRRLAEFCESPTHSFWSDDLSITRHLEPQVRQRITGHRQVTDFYLVANAVRHGGLLATFDGSLVRSLASTAMADSIELIQQR